MVQANSESFAQKGSELENIPELPDRRAEKITSLVAISSHSILPSISSFERLVRIMFWCYKFCHHNKQVGDLTVKDLNKAEMANTRVVQREFRSFTVFSESVYLKGTVS